MKKLGLGIQAFADFTTHNFIYVDKTEQIYKLIDDGKYYFLSRPRRFGKSLLVDTIKELFSGNKAVFKECWVYDQWNWEKTHPVIKLSFAEINYRKHGLEKALELALTRLAESHQIALTTESYGEQFLELIAALGKETPVAVLIDEYDKPIIDYLEQSEFEQALKNREILKTFYAGVKDQDQYLRFFFLTGVSKFSRVSIFSDLNHLTDISISKHFSTLLGYTATEIEKYYALHLRSLCQAFAQPEAELMEKVTEWYNGYSWDGNHFVFNPYSIISLFYQQAFRNFWFETGTPTFLIKRLKQENKTVHEEINTLVDEAVFNKYDIENINITAIMFQTGYLTLKAVDYEENKYLLDFPNKEVRDSFLNFAVEHYANSSSREMGHIVGVLLDSLACNDIKGFFDALHSLFASITVKQLDKVKNYEGFYHSIIYIVLKILGVHIACEIQSHFGTTDAVIQTDRYIYVMEFKMGTAETAIEQIRKRKYHAPYLADKRKIVLVGLGFDKAVRNLLDYAIENVE